MCKSAGIESTIIIEDSKEKIVGAKPGYFDPSGEFISPKRDTMIFTQYKCSQGHRFTTSSKPPSQEVSPQE